MIRIAIGVGVALLIGVVCYNRRSLTLAGAALASVMMVLACALGGYGAMGVLVISYFCAAAAGKIGTARRESIASSLHQKIGTRDVFQVASNGSSACIMLVFYAIGGHPCLLAAYCAGIIESLSDSVASDIGMLSRRTSYDIVRWKPVATGISGGVTLLGTGCALLSSLLLGALSLALLPEIRAYGWLVIGASFIGSLLDSVLGSLAQVKFRCRVCGKTTERTHHCDQRTEYLSGIAWLNNGAVNFICHTTACLIVVLIG